MIYDLNKIHIDCLDRIDNDDIYAPDYRVKRKNGTITPEELKDLNTCYKYKKKCLDIICIA